MHFERCVVPALIPFTPQGVSMTYLVRFCNRTREKKKKTPQNDSQLINYNTCKYL